MTDAPIFLNSSTAIRRHLRRAFEPSEFASYGVRFVLCDGGNRVLVHCHVGDVPADAGQADCTAAVSAFVHAAATVGQPGSILMALTRPGPPALLPADRRWFRIAHAVCSDHHVRLLGVHVVTPHGQREIVLDDAL